MGNRGGNKAKTWIVRDANGNIFGPFSTEQVLVQIDRGYFVGGEQVALYPGGRWIAISKAPEFYDRLLDALEQRDDSKSTADKSVMLQKASTTRQVNPPTPSQPVDPSEAPTKSLPQTNPQLPAVQGEHSRQGELMPMERSRATGVGFGSGVIELTDLKKIEELEAQSEAKRQKQIRLLIITLFALIIGYYLSSSDEPLIGKGQRIRLLAPRKGQTEMPLARIREKYQRGVIGFQQDIFSGYQTAQSEFVEVLEGRSADPEKAAPLAEVASMLCLTYRELWPYAYQDAQDIKVVREAVQIAKGLDPGGLNGAICEIVQLLLAAKFTQAEQAASSRLEIESSAPILFEMRADAYLSTRDYSSASVFFERAAQLWPDWQKIHIGYARAKSRQRAFGEAVKSYRAVLAKVPRHSVAKIELALIELREFNHVDVAQQLLLAALEKDDRPPAPTESEAWLARAEIALKRNNRDEALRFANKALEVNPANAPAKQMVVELGGDASKSTRGNSRELVFAGDQFVKSGDCFAAQAQYRAAFDVDPKNGMAALKAGRCLWQLNQTQEAIDWMKKAIEVEPTLTLGYVELADYHAQRHDYQSAFRLLARIQQRQPKNYEVFRGFAQIELRRNNFAGAEKFAQRALELYSTDLDTYIIMTKALLGQRKFVEARSYAERALEVDPTHIEANSLMAKVRAGLHGVDEAAVYLRGLINGFVITQGRGVPLAAIVYRVTLAEIYLQDERYKLAEEAARQAVSLDETHKPALMVLGKVLQGNSQPRLALEYFLKAAVLDPSDAEPVFWAGRVYTEVQKYKDAVAQFERVIQINPRYPLAHVSLGRAYLALGMRDQALKEAMLERQTNPDLADSYTLAAEVFYELRQYGNCASEYQNSVRKQSATRTTADANILVRLARCYRLSGDVEAAQSLLRQAQALESGNPDVYKEQGAIFHTRGMADEAIEAYDKYLRLLPNAADKAEVEKLIKRIQAGDMTP
ncbi:MAG TPA: tetratricopeptide repeat protein [Pseudobdellovibrionaceae bacterium]|nr:tetratricopeptide repeat protein [Pseudobdellovibrionaceae bacterium]